MAIIGIDLGTSNSAAAVLRGGRPMIIPGAEGVTLGGKACRSCGWRKCAVLEFGATLQRTDFMDNSTERGSEGTSSASGWVHE